MSLIDPVTNFAEVTVSTGYDDTATTIDLTGGAGALLPSTGGYNLTWWNSTDYPNPVDDPNVEIIRVVSRATDQLSVTRAQEGTSASTHNTGSKTYKMVLSLTKKTIDDIRDNLWTMDATPTGTVNGSNTVFTIPSATAVVVYADGLRVKGGGVDYTFSGNTTITFEAGSQPYNSISVDYSPS